MPVLRKFYPDSGKKKKSKSKPTHFDEGTIPDTTSVLEKKISSKAEILLPEEKKIKDH